MTATETLLKIIELTNKNLEILGLINESFFTNKEHLTTVVDGTRYTIPSFISLENKINHLQAAFNNLVHAPMSGEAYMNFDGNSRVIQMRGFQQGPSQVNLDNQTNTDLYKLSRFFVEDSNLFKDMLSPKPYIKLDLSELEDDITQVVVKKIVPYSEGLIKLLTDSGASSDTVVAIDYGVMRAILDSGKVFKKGLDYAEYETIYNLPIRKLTCFGEYIISDIKSDVVDDKLNNIITVQLDERTPTTCTIYDGLTTRNLRAGDILTTYDGSARLEIIGLTQSTRTLELKVLSGEYLNILPNSKSVDDKVSDYSKLRFYKPEDFDSDKYLNIPLEEDEHVYISIAPLNSRMNTQANWGTGLYINVDGLSMEDGKGFRDYYNENVKNIGDTINELASILPKPLTNLNSVEFNTIREAKPYLTNIEGNIDTLQVVQINKHLNEAENIKTIRNLYSQKQQYKTDLNECQNKIATLTSELSEISFDDMSGSRAMISAQIDSLKARQNELIASINTAIDAISLAANDSEVPIEDSKFRIRGYIDIDRFISRNGLENYADYVRAVKVRYRYKNPGLSQLSNVSTVGDFLFTEWNTYSAGPRHKTASYNAGTYITKFDEPALSDNDIKFNQVDIPITQGEQVDIQAKIIWDFGYPFVSIESDWSDAITVAFPQELAADVQVTTIIKENNSDIETYRFENILTNHGITEHANDYIDDQNIRYFHKPESISSGFYTSERRVIPLADKLKDMNTQLASIQDMLVGTHAESLQVTLNVNNTEYVLKPDIQNIVYLSAYNTVPVVSDASTEMVGQISRGNADAPATTFGSITIKNVTDHTLRLFSMVPGARDQGMTTSRRFQRTLNREYDYAQSIKAEGFDNISGTEPIVTSGRSKARTADTDGDVGFAITKAPESTVIQNDPNDKGELIWELKYVNPQNSSAPLSSLTITPSIADITGVTIEVIVGDASYEYRGEQITLDKGPISPASSSNNEGGDFQLKISLGEGSKKNYERCVLTLQSTVDNVTFGTDVEFSVRGFGGGTTTVPSNPDSSEIELRVEPASIDFGNIEDLTSVKQTVRLLCIFPKTTSEIQGPAGRIDISKVGNGYFQISGSTNHVQQPAEGNTTVMEYTITYEPKQAGGHSATFRFNWVPLNWIGPQSEVGTSLSCKGSTARANSSNSSTPGVVNNYYIVQQSELQDYTGGKMVYVMNPHEVVLTGSGGTMQMDKVFSEQPCNNFALFRIKEPFGGSNMGDPTEIRSGVKDDSGVVQYAEDTVGVGSLEQQQNIIKMVSNVKKPTSSFVYATPTTANPYDLCIQSDAVQSVMELGPGDSKTIPIFIAYFMKPETPNSAYTLGFDIRNSLYNDPIFYQVTLAARLNQTFEDLLQSQKASVANQANYNPVIRV